MDRTTSNSEKIAFFRSLFCGRADVVARRIESAKSGKKGYAPYCANQWVRELCVLSKGWKCSDCPNRKFISYSDEVARWHLRGFDAEHKKFEIGVYPMNLDETVSFAAMDFDKVSWRRDVLSVIQKVHEVGLPVALERSRSGKGAHIWFYFSEPMNAKIVRAVLSYILTLTLESHPEKSLDSYEWTYDYYDSEVAMCEQMFEKRRRGYESIGYSVVVPKGAAEGWPAEVVLPVEPKWNERFSGTVSRLCSDGVDAALAELFLHATLSISNDDGAINVNSKGEINWEIRSDLFSRNEKGERYENYFDNSLFQERRDVADGDGIGARAERY